MDENHSLCFENAAWRIELTRRAQHIEIALDDKANARRWGPAALLRLHFHDKMYQRVEIAGRYDILSFERAEGGAHITIGLGGMRRLSAGFWLRLTEDELAVQLYPAEMYEAAPELYRWASLDLFPGLMQIGPDGALLLPITTGVLCCPRDKPKITDRFLIYGEQERSELLPLLPFCAAADDGGGLMALATRGAADTACFVATDGQGNGETGLGFHFRRYWPDPLDFQTREMRFLSLPRGVRAELGIARRLHRHAIEDLGRSTLRQRAAESPEVAYALQAYTMKLFFGLQNETGIIRTLYNPGDRGSGTNFDVMMTFAGCQEALRRLHNAGLDKILTFATGWSPRGHDGLYPTRLPPDERLGGEAGFRKLLNCGQELGYQMSVHDNYIDGYKVSPDWNAQHAIQDIYGEPLVMGLWGGGILYKLWPLALPEERLGDQMRRVRELGVSGLFYCDAMGNLLQVNYHPHHGGPRSDHARGVQRVLECAREIFGGAAAECGFLYTAVAADCIATVGWNEHWKKGLKPQWPITTLCDRQLPIWQLALHDLVMLEGHGLSWPDVMQKVLLGLHPRTEWCLRPGLYIPPLDDALIAALKADYDMTLGRFGYLQTLQMTDYQEPEDGTAISTFEDNTEITANFTTGELWANGEPVACPAALGHAVVDL